MPAFVTKQRSIGERGAQGGCQKQESVRPRSEQLAEDCWHLRQVGKQSWHQSRCAGQTGTTNARRSPSICGIDFVWLPPRHRASPVAAFCGSASPAVHASHDVPARSMRGEGWG